MGWRFTLKTFISVGLVSVMSGLHPKMVQLSQLTPFYVALIGGSLMGVGFIVLFRHQASLGGINILTLYCKKSMAYAPEKSKWALIFASSLPRS